MRPKSCLNCKNPLAPYDKFCPSCGQKTDTRRITFRQLFVDFLQVFAHAERGLWRLFRGLGTAPGKTVVDYIDGKRRGYFNPFGFLAITVAVMLFINGLLKPYDQEFQVDPNVYMPDDRARYLYHEVVDRMNKFQAFGNRFMNFITVLAAPWFGFGLWIFFSSRGRNAAEITVAYMLLSAFVVLVTNLIFSPILSITRGSGLYWPIFALSLLLQTLFVTAGFNIFFGYRSTSGYFRVLGALFLIGFVGFVIFMLVYYLYVFGGERGVVFRYMFTRPPG